MTKLEHVFGISASVESPSYVDRGQLDERFKRALASDRHVAVHGGSKQGKSWLRTKGLAQDRAILLQCTPSSTPASLLSEALGGLDVRAEIKMTETHDLQGTLDLTAAAELGWWARAKVKGSASATGARGSATESQPIGQSPGHLSWVSAAIAESGKRLVLEDFHYISEESQKELAFLLKAMGEYGLFVIVVGVWPKDHLLTYYNGDLEGRVDDIHLKWEDSELKQVLIHGADALGIKIPSSIMDELVAEASGNVGLIQRLAEQLCIVEGVRESTSHTKATAEIGTVGSVNAAKRSVADQMEGRFQTFADNFVRGMRRLPEGLEVYKFLLQSATGASDRELSEGIDSAALLSRMAEHGGEAIRASDLTQALDRIDRLQVKINVRPPVLTYSRSGRKLFLADRAFLFFRRNGDPHWPWMPGEPDITNDLAVDEPLLFDSAT